MAAVLMAVDTGQSSLLVDICGKIVGFHTVRARRRSTDGERGTVFPVVIVLIPALVIAAHIVAVVATQALKVRGGTKGMGLQFSACEGEVAGTTTCAMSNGRILITRRIDMAAQAASAEHIVGQCERGCKRSGDRDVLRSGQAVLRAKTGPDRVDFFAKSEMQGMGRIGYLPGMACTAGSCHVRRVGGFSNQADVGLVDLPFIIEAAMAGGAGQIVGRVEFNRFVATCATGCFGLNRYRLAGGNYLRFWRSRILGTATAEQQENNE